MKTIVVCIGNSDNKLTQSAWSMFVENMDRIIRKHTSIIHFWGGPPNYAEWQNVLWMFDCDEYKIPSLKGDIVGRRITYQQDSVAWIEGETEFL